MADLDSLASNTLSRSTLGTEQLHQEVAALGPRWTVAGIDLCCELRGASMTKCGEAAAYAAKLADEMEHHPRIVMEYPGTTLTIHTHDANAITVMDMVLAGGLLLAAVTIVAPAITTARSRWLVLAGTAVTLAAVLYDIAHRADPGDLQLATLLLWALPLTTVAAAHDVAIRRLLLVGGMTFVAAPCVFVAGLVFGTSAGQLFTSLAGNPPQAIARRSGRVSGQGSSDTRSTPKSIASGVTFGASGQCSRTVPAIARTPTRTRASTPEGTRK